MDNPNAAETQADELIGDLVDFLEFSLRKMDAPSGRRIMRRYGIKFYYREDEPRDPDDPAPVE